MSQNCIFPPCPKCNKGYLVPLSAFSEKGVSLVFSSWVCTNPECSYTIHQHDVESKIYWKGGEKMNAKKARKAGII